MRGGVVAVGVFMMIVGFILVSMFGFSWSLRPGTTGGITLFSPQLIGIGLIAIGFLVFIVGLAASPTPSPRYRPRHAYTPVERARALIPKPPRKPIPKQEQKPTILAICPNCKARIPADSKFCLECGADLRPKSENTPTKND